jgi:hypothetical protein
MCEMRVISEKNGIEEILGENITSLTVSDTGVHINSLFEGPIDLPEMIIEYIDFTAGKVVLTKEKQ